MLSNNKPTFKILILFFILTFLGIIIVPRLSVKLNPNKNQNTITINYSWKNASSLAIERRVTSVLESGFNTLNGVSKISSKSSKESGSITIEFDKYTNFENARFETSMIVRQLYEKLPNQVSYPRININKLNNDNPAFLTYSVTAPETSFKIKETINNQIIPSLGTISGINEINIFGANQKEYILTYNDDILKSLNISKLDIINSIKREYDFQSFGVVLFNTDNITLSIQPQNKVDWHIPVKKTDNKIIYLDEIISINKQEKENRSYYRVNGDNTITLSIYALKNFNTILLSKIIDKTLYNESLNLPENYKIIKLYDNTQYLELELSKIYKRSFYTVIILLLFILVVSNSFNYLIVVIFSLASNISLSFLLYYVFNIEIQLYSLAGITISLGLIIDNNIVMIEQIRKQSNNNIFIPILASTLTTIGALSIIHFLDDVYKSNLIDFAFVIIINLSVSLIIALFLIPALLQKIKIPIKKEKKWTLKLKERFYYMYAKFISFLLRFKKLAIVFIVLIFGLPIFMLPQKFESNKHWYQKTYNATLGSEWYQENVRLYLDQYLGGSLRLFSNYVFEKAYYSSNESTKLYIIGSMDKGTTVHQLNDVFIELENFLKGQSKIKNFTTQINSSDYGIIEISFSKGIEISNYPLILKSNLIRRVFEHRNIDWKVYGVGNIFVNSNNNLNITDFKILSKGYDYSSLNTWLDTLKQMLQVHPRISNIVLRENSRHFKKPSYEYLFNLNKEHLSLLNTTPSTVMNNLKSKTLSKNQDISLNIQGRYTSLRFNSKVSSKFDIWHVNNTPLDSLEKPMSLKNIAKIIKVPEDENIHKENQEFIKILECSYLGQRVNGLNYLNNKLSEFKKKLPLGYSFILSNNHPFFDKDKSYSNLLILVFLIIYFICAILFESMKQPLIIIGLIPISFIGVFLTFYLFNFNFDQGGLASFVLLSGITVNASIFIINDFNKLQIEFPNKDKLPLYLEAFKQKIFPIMLTIFSTILGFIPFVKDGQNEVFWFALGVGTIGGLLFSLIGILCYLPIFTLKKN